MNRVEFQELAEVRIQEATALLIGGLYDGAYYLAGYAIECALKACIAKLTKEYDFPDKDMIKNGYTHDIETLVKTAKLVDERTTDMIADADLAANSTASVIGLFTTGGLIIV